VDPAFSRPKLRAGVVARRFTAADGEAYYIAKSTSARTYVRLAPDEYFLLGLMDGERQLKDLVRAYFLEYHRFAFQRIVDAVDQLRQQRFLVEEPRDMWAGLQAQLAQRSWTYRVDRLIKSFRYHEFPLNGLDPVITALYRYGGWLCFTRPAVALGVMASVFGALLFFWELSHGTHDPLRVGGSYTLGFLALLALWLLAISVHELGHALATKHYGREVPCGGVMLYYGMPAFFTDTTDIWLEPRRARLVVSLAGIATLWGLGGLAMLYVWWQPAAPLAAFAFQFAFVAYVTNSFQLLPLLELDGYYALMDWLELPLLRARAFAFVRGDLWRKLRRHEPFDREERIFAVYGSLALAYSAFALGLAAYFWYVRLHRLALDAWSHGSPLWQALAALVVVGFGGPFLFGLTLKLRQGVLAVRGGITRWRHHPQQARAQARLDARALVGKLRFLGELSFAEREAVVAQLTLRRFPAGAYVTRQGEPGEHFYLIRRGEAVVVQVDASSWPRELGVLRRGDYFGELALLCHQPHSASIRTLTPLEAYALDRATFETAIAPRLHDCGYTLRRIEERAELARMPLFQRAAVSELEPVLERLRAVDYPTGVVIVRQGDVAAGFFLIRDGCAVVTFRNAAGEEHWLGTLSAGDHFGEVALLAGQPYAATVRAEGPARLWRLDRADFEQLLLGQLGLRPALAAISAQRTATRRRLAGERAA
jgi:putative peptide zinc metalloprotease protein